MRINWKDVFKFFSAPFLSRRGRAGIFRGITSKNHIAANPIGTIPIQKKL
jgi:hypothetical protein